jgi:hypothetical protein
VSILLCGFPPRGVFSVPNNVLCALHLRIEHHVCGHDVHLHILTPMQRSGASHSWPSISQAQPPRWGSHVPKGMSWYTTSLLGAWRWLSDHKFTVLECLGDTLGAIIDRICASSLYLHLNSSGMFRPAALRALLYRVTPRRLGTRDPDVFRLAAILLVETSN